MYGLSYLFCIIRNYFVKHYFSLVKFKICTFLRLNPGKKLFFVISERFPVTDVDSDNVVLYF